MQQSNQTMRRAVSWTALITVFCMSFASTVHAETTNANGRLVFSQKYSDQMLRGDHKAKKVLAPRVTSGWNDFFKEYHTFSTTKSEAKAASAAGAALQTLKSLKASVQHYRTNRLNNMQVAREALKHLKREHPGPEFYASIPQSTREAAQSWGTHWKDVMDTAEGNRVGMLAKLAAARYRAQKVMNQIPNVENLQSVANAVKAYNSYQQQIIAANQELGLINSYSKMFESATYTWATWENSGTLANLPLDQIDAILKDAPAAFSASRFMSPQQKAQAKADNNMVNPLARPDLDGQ